MRKTDKVDATPGTWQIDGLDRGGAPNGGETSGGVHRADARLMTSEDVIAGRNAWPHKENAWPHSKAWDHSEGGPHSGGDHLLAAGWAAAELGFEPDERQAAVLNSAAARGVLNCTRQWGKSTVTAAMAIHQAYTRAESLTLVVSPTARQSGEFVRKAARFALRLGIPPKGDGDNEISLVLPNGSRIVGLPGTEGTIRGFSAVSLLLVDEASRVSDELYIAIRPMLAVSAGKLWLMSTPCGKRGFFHEAWARGGPEWERIQVTGYECPRIPATFLEEERKTMGERWFRQEYLCEFTDSASGVFDSDAVERAMRDDVEPLYIP